MASGYTPCACRDCFDTAVSNNMDDPDLCNDCESADCDRDGESECQRSDAYGMDEDEDEDEDSADGTDKKKFATTHI